MFAVSIVEEFEVVCGLCGMVTWDWVFLRLTGPGVRGGVQFCRDGFLGFSGKMGREQMSCGFRTVRLSGESRSLSVPLVLTFGVEISSVEGMLSDSPVEQYRSGQSLLPADSSPYSSAE